MATGGDKWVRNWGCIYGKDEVELGQQIANLKTELGTLDGEIVAKRAEGVVAEERVRVKQAEP